MHIVLWTDLCNLAVFVSFFFFDPLFLTVEQLHLVSHCNWQRWSYKHHPPSHGHFIQKGFYYYFIKKGCCATWSARTHSSSPWQTGFAEIGSRHSKVLGELKSLWRKISCGGPGFLRVGTTSMLAKKSQQRGPSMSSLQSKQGSRQQYIPSEDQPPKCWTGWISWRPRVCSQSNCCSTQDTKCSW